MKTILSKHPWRALAGMSALVLTAGNLAAAPSVATLTGGPSYGHRNGATLEVATFHTPLGLAFDPSGSLLYVADRDNNAIRALDLGADLTYDFATRALNKPVGVAVDKDGNVYVLNRGNGSNGTVLTFDEFGDLLTTNAVGLVNANGIAMDSQKNIYVTCGNSVVQTTPDGDTGTLVTVTGTGAVLQGIAVEDNGLLAVCDSGRHGVLLIDPSTGDVTSLTGFNGAGEHFGPASFAKFNQPMGIAAAGGGVLVVADYGNHRVKVVDPSGTVTNLYGVDSPYWRAAYPGWADGTVARGDVNYNAYYTVESRLPAGVLFAADGSVYSTEDYYHIIRKVTGAGLPLHPPPPPPVPAPQIGWVKKVSGLSGDVSQLQTGQSFIFNDDVIIAILGTDGTETHYTYGATPVGVDTIPNPSATSGATPPAYANGTPFNQVPPTLVAPQPDLTIKAIGTAPGRLDSPIVSARFQFKAANPTISGNNAAIFTVSNITANVQMWYTIDGSDPTNGAPSLGPVASGATLSLNIATNVTFKIRAFRANFNPSDVVSQTFSVINYNANKISFGFTSGEASSDFVGSSGQMFYAPVTLSTVPGTRMYSLQFSMTVTNAGPNAGPPVAPGMYNFQSMLVKPVPGDTNNPPYYEQIPPLMFVAEASDPPPLGQLVTYDNNPAFVNMVITNSSLNLLGVGWLERFGKANLYNTRQQDLITFSMAHDTLFLSANGNVVVGGYAFQVPPTATAGQTYQIQLSRPSATSDGIGAPGSDVYISTPTNGSLAAGSLNSLKVVTVGQRKYVAGDCYPFRWFNAGDFGDVNLDDADVMQVFQSAIYGLNTPPQGSDFFDSMDSCGGLGVLDPNGYLTPGATLTDPSALNALFDGNDTTINSIPFGDGVLDVCDVYVTFRRSLDPSLTWYRRFWTNGVRAAEIVGNPPTPQQLQAAAMAVPKSLSVGFQTNPPVVNFSAKDLVASAGQTLQIPITAQVIGSYPARLLMLNLSVVPLDGSPALTSAVQFTPNPALGTPATASSSGNGNYSAAWLDATVAGLSGTANVGTLTVQVPATAGSTAAYAIRFDHASASPNGLASFPKQTLTGLITLAPRTNSVFADAIPDSWRLRYFGTVNNLLSQASADADGDGVDNLHEYLAGTDPTDKASALRVSMRQAAAQQAQGSVVRWPSVAGKHYVIEGSASLFPGTWSTLSTNAGTGTDMEFHDTTGGAVRFYRVQVTP